MPSRILVNAYLCVDLFFMLSGFVLAYVYHGFSSGIKSSDYRSYLLARFARIYPSHLFTLGVVLVLEFAALAIWANSEIVHSRWAPPFTAEQSLPSFFSNIFLVQTLHWGAFWNVPAWSLSAEFFTYLWLPWLISALAFANARTCALVVVVSLGCLLAIEAFFGDLGIAFAGWPQIVRAGAGAALGVVAWRCYRQNYLLFLSGAWLLPVFAFTLCTLALPLPATSVMPVFFGLVLIAARNQAKPSWLFHNPFSVWLGRISFALYLVHWIVFDALRQLCIWFTGKGLGANLGLSGELATLAGLLCLCCGLAWALQRWVEVPARVWVVRRFS